VSYTQVNFQAGSETWAISGIAVANGGSGYTSGQSLAFTLDDHDTSQAAATAVISTSGGVIVSVQVTNGGVFYKRGIPDSVNILSRGRYFFYDATKTLPATQAYPRSLTAEIYNYVIDPGTRLPSLSPDIDPLGLRVPPTLSVTADENLESPTFGDVTALALQNGGSGWVAWTTAESCFDFFNGRTLTLRSQGVIRQTVRICLQSKYGSRVLGTPIPVDYDNLETGLSVNPLDIGGFGFAYRARIEPRVTITGFGASYTARWRPILTANKLPAWELQHVDVSGGSWNAMGSVVQLSLQGETAQDKFDGDPALVSLWRNRIEPDLQATTPCHNGGAVFEIAYEVLQDAPQVYGVRAIRIVDGGSGYSGSVPLRFTVSAGSTSDEQACAVAFPDSEGRLSFVRILSPGRYYKEQNTPGKAVVTRGGVHYRETNDLPPIYDPNTSIVVFQDAPSHGSGAAFAFTVDLDVSSGTFGRLTALSVTSPGTGYILQYLESSAIYVDECSLSQGFSAGKLKARCVVSLEQGCRPVVFVYPTRTDFPCAANEFESTTTSVNEAILVFGDSTDAGAALTPENRTVVLSPVLPGNSGTCTVQWGGEFDDDNKLCSCCEQSTSYCREPCPVETPKETEDPFGLVALMSCAGYNEAGDFLENEDNGGPQMWRAVFDQNDNFVEYQLLCGECIEAVQRGLDEDFFPVFLTQTPPAPLVERGRRGVTDCLCFSSPQQSPLGCVWDVEIGADGCWTGNYVLVQSRCENPLP
jgi:hypothetical protein